MDRYEVERYKTPNGRVPITDWILGLKDHKARTAIDRRIYRLEEGNFGDHKFCSDGVWELRIDVGPGYRLYYGLAGAKLVLLVCGGDKQTQSSDILRAAQYWHDWQGGTTK
jgi:putative addiction module killer protein